MLSLNKIDYLNHMMGSTIMWYSYHYSFFFQNVKTNVSFIAHGFLSNKHNQSCSYSCPINMTFNKDSSLNFVVRKLYSNFSHQYSNSQSVTNNKSNMFCTSVGLLGENTFRSKFCLKAFNFFTGKFLFSLKKKLKGGDI